MLARAVKPNCDGLHDMAKHLLIWSFAGKRKFSANKNFKYENGGHRAPKRRQMGQEPFYKSKMRINWNNMTLKPFTKNFYSPHPDVLNRSQNEIQEFWEKNEIKITGNDVPAPIFTFEEAGLSDRMISLVRKMNFENPTAIQSQGWPIALSGRNMVGIARTGSGKTLGFILPAVIHVQHQPELVPGDGPIVLVLAPTRELVQQTHAVANKFGNVLGLRSVAVYGGSNRHGQEEKLRKGAEICVATPGRLLDFLNYETTNLARCTYLVIDEADRMFDMGFEPQIRGIIEQIRPDRQVLMWSATWPKEIRFLAQEYLEDYIQLTVGSLELMANPNINQVVHVCKEFEKEELLKSLLEDILKEKENKTLIFVSTKSNADYISYQLNKMRYKSKSIHGGKSQSERDNILWGFRNGKTNILVATDVAARGLDVSDIRYVINFDYPQDLEDYIHRIGRTGRHNASGTSHTFFTEKDSRKAGGLVSVLRDANQRICPKLLQIANVSSNFASRNSYRNGFGEWGNSY